MEEKEEDKAIKYGGFWVRFLAVIIDSIVVGIVVSPVSSILFPGSSAITSTHGNYAANPADSLRSLVLLVYAVLMLYYYGATLGKMVFKLKVVDENYEKPTILTIIIRETIGKFLSAVALGIGFIWVGFDPKKQGWHDKIAKTYVVYSKK